MKGILRPSFNATFSTSFCFFAIPDITRKPDEDWTDHFSRLKAYHETGKRHGLFYNLDFRCLNATDFGVPQRRERVFIVGFRGDLEVEWAFPTPTHSMDSLLRTKWITGEYWDRHKVPTGQRHEPYNRASSDRLDRIRAWLNMDVGHALENRRDAISTCPILARATIRRASPTIG